MWRMIWIVSVSLIFSLVSCGKSSGGDTAASGSEQVIAEELIEATFDPLYAGTPREHSSNIVGAIAGNSTDILLYDNPDRGYRTTTPLNILPAHPDPDDPTKTSETCDLIIRDEKTGRVRYNSKSKCSGKHDVRWTYGNLDNETADGIMRLLTSINQEKGTAIVMVTHNRQIFEKYRGRVMVCQDESCTEQTDTDIIDLELTI